MWSTSKPSASVWSVLITDLSSPTCEVWDHGDHGTRWGQVGAGHATGAWLGCTDDRTVALMEDIKAGLQADPLSKQELDHLSKGLPSPCYSLSSSGLILLDHCVYVPDYRPTQGKLHTHILQSRHDDLTAGHFGFNKTLTLLHWDYAWPSIHTNCKNPVMQCVLCTHNKPNHHCPYRLLQPWPIPEWPWHSISMDFIEQLPLSGRFMLILVVIDHLSKESVFIPTTDNPTTMCCRCLCNSCFHETQHSTWCHGTIDWLLCNYSAPIPHKENDPAIPQPLVSKQTTHHPFDLNPSWVSLLHQERVCRSSNADVI